MAGLNSTNLVPAYAARIHKRPGPANLPRLVNSPAHPALTASLQGQSGVPRHHPRQSKAGVVLVGQKDNAPLGDLAVEGTTWGPAGVTTKAGRAGVGFS